MSSTVAPAHLQETNTHAFYRAAWRWHFYSGLYVAPFMIMLAVTGLIMLYGNVVETRFGPRFAVGPVTTPAPVTQQAQAALAAIPGGTIALYVAPRDATRPSIFMVEKDGVQHAVSVHPETAAVLGQIVRDDTWYYWASDVHGTLLIGDFGDWLIEIAAGLGVLLVLTGLYMWVPRNGRALGAALVPRLSLRGRMLWKELHVSVGFWTSLLMLGFLITGMAWTGVWGSKLVQPWSTFPAAKWDNVPLSDKTHASMNHGASKDVAWALEQTPLPKSGSAAGSAQGVAIPVTLDSVAAFAQHLGFKGQHRIAPPKDEIGVYTISADSMDGDTEDPFSDRTVHIDRYTGKVLADVGFADYGWVGKTMAVSIALHQGDLGWWSIALNTAFCLAVILLSASGVVMWWLRRPRSAFSLAPPPLPSDLPRWSAAIVIAAVVAILFPLAGAVIVSLVLLDWLLLSRVPALRYLFK